MFCSLDFEYLKKKKKWRRNEGTKWIEGGGGGEKEGKTNFYKWYLAYISSLNFKFKMENLIIEAIYRWKYLMKETREKKRRNFL